MKDNFDRSFELTIGHEGGFQNDSRDRGNWTTGKIGKGQNKGTKYGITAMSYPTLDIKNLTLDDARAIYKRDFWDKVKADDLPYGVDYIVWDMAVNHGPKKAVELLQRAIGAVPDGIIGPRSMDRVNKRDPEDMIVETCARRAVYYAGIKTVDVYGLGWMRRLTSSLVQAVDMARNTSEFYFEPVLDESKAANVNEEPSGWSGGLANLFRRV